MGCRHIEGAAHLDCAALHVTHEPNVALVVAQGLRLDDAGVVNRTLQQTGCRLCG